MVIKKLKHNSNSYGRQSFHRDQVSPYSETALKYYATLWAMVAKVHLGEVKYTSVKEANIWILSIGLICSAFAFPSAFSANMNA